MGFRTDDLWVYVGADKGVYLQDDLTVDILESAGSGALFSHASEDAANCTMEFVKVDMYYYIAMVAKRPIEPGMVYIK